MQLWIPVLVVLYLSVAYGNLDIRGRSDQEIYPFSALPMFMRINSNEEDFERLARLRRKIERVKEEKAAGNKR